MEIKHINSGIYQIINLINNKRYIGSAYDLNSRCGRHFIDLKKNQHYNLILQRAYNKHGKENFKFEILLYCDKKDLIFFEQRAMDSFNKKELYNIRTRAENNEGLKHTEEIKKEMSIRFKGKNNPMYGSHPSTETIQKLKNRKPSMLGKNHSEESKKKIGESSKNRVPSTVTRLKMSISRIGKIHSEETKRKISESHKGLNNPNYGKHPSLETINKLKESRKGKKPNLGNKHTEETKNKISMATIGKNNPMYGKKHSEESKLKISRSKKNILKKENDDV